MSCHGRALHKGGIRLEWNYLTLTHPFTCPHKWGPRRVSDTFVPLHQLNWVPCTWNFGDLVWAAVLYKLAALWSCSQDKSFSKLGSPFKLLAATCDKKVIENWIKVQISRKKFFEGILSRHLEQLEVCSKKFTAISRCYQLCVKSMRCQPPHALPASAAS